MSGAERERARGKATSDFLFVVVAAVVVGLGLTISGGSHVTRLASGSGWRPFEDLWKRSSAAVTRISRTTTLSVPTSWASPWGWSKTKERNSYSVRPSDTLARIAEAHGVALSALVSINRIEDVDKLEVSQTLLIPEPGAAN